jgi:hypothetical protein
MFKGIFVYPRTMFTEYCWACSEKQAYVVLAGRVAKKQGVFSWEVLKYFKDKRDKVKITIEVEFKEEEDDEDR